MRAFGDWYRRGGSWLTPPPNNLSDYVANRRRDEIIWRAALEWLGGTIEGREAGYEIFDRIRTEIDND